MSEKAKVWITKWAFTKKGVICRLTEIMDDGAWAVGPDGSYVGKSQFHYSPEAANQKVLQMIAAKRKSIAKQLAKLDKLEAEINAAH